MTHPNAFPGSEQVSCNKAQFLPIVPDDRVEYEPGPHTLAIGQAPGWSPSPDGLSCALQAVDFDATITFLKAAGVTFTMEPFETPICHMAMVFDPAGNIIIIHKRKPGHP